MLQYTHLGADSPFFGIGTVLAMPSTPALEGDSNLVADGDRMRDLRHFLRQLASNPRRQQHRSIALRLSWSDRQTVREAIEEVARNPNVIGGVGWFINGVSLPMFRSPVLFLPGWSGWEEIRLRNGNNCTYWREFKAILERRGFRSALTQTCLRCRERRKCAFERQRTVRGLRLLEHGLVFTQDFARSPSIVVVEGRISPAKGRSIPLDSVYETGRQGAYEPVRVLLLAIVALGETLAVNETVEGNELLARLADMGVSLGEVALGWLEPLLPHPRRRVPILPQRHEGPMRIPGVEEAQDQPYRFVEDMLSILLHPPTFPRQASVVLTQRDLHITSRMSFVHHLGTKPVILIGPSKEMVEDLNRGGWRFNDTFALPEEDTRRGREAEIWSVPSLLWDVRHFPTVTELSEASEAHPSTVSRWVSRWNEEAKVELRRLPRPGVGGIRLEVTPPGSSGAPGASVVSI